MRHTITITFETSDDLSVNQKSSVQDVQWDMRDQLETLADLYDESSRVEYSDVTVDYSNDLDEKIDQILLAPKEVDEDAPCACKWCTT
jgi:hypothetical protein